MSIGTAKICGSRVRHSQEGDTKAKETEKQKEIDRGKVSIFIECYSEPVRPTEKTDRKERDTKG